MVEFNKNFSNPINNKKNQLSFTGHSLISDNLNAKAYEFIHPDKNAKLVATVIDDKGKTVSNFETQKVKNDTISVYVASTKDLKPNQRVRFEWEINGKRMLDPTEKTVDGQYNLAIPHERPTMETSRFMYHLMPDSANPKNVGVYDQRNHVNKYGGKLPDVTEIIKDIREMGFKRIIGTPIFGDDRVSDHGYWAVNTYQITKTLASKQGGFNDFKDMQTELLKNGMSWIADGAFANEGLEGIHIQDIIKWGEDSPFLDCFDLKDFNTRGFRFGVLPRDGTEAAKHYDFKLINSPVLYDIDANGNPTEKFGTRNLNYNKNEPTYVQLYDKRLVNSEDRISNNIITQYAKKQTNNIHDIRTYQDSVQLFTMRVDAKDVENQFLKISKLPKHAGTPEGISPYREMLKEWKNVKFEQVQKDGTVRLWVGNKDIAALNYGSQQVQDYVLGTAKYWTNETDKHHTQYIASHLRNEMADGKTTLSQAIQRLSENGVIDKTAYDRISNSLNEKGDILADYVHDLSPAHSNVSEALKEFPLVASEMPRDVVSLLASPELLTNGKSPSKLENAYSKKLAPIIKKIIVANNPALIDKATNELTQEGAQIFRLASSDIMRYVAASALGGVKPEVKFINGLTKLIVNDSELNKNIHSRIDVNASSRAKSVDSLVSAFENGIDDIASNKEALTDLSKIVANVTQKVDFNSLQAAKMIVNRLEHGLEWRIDAAKDIADLVKLAQGKSTFKQTFDTITDFWVKFNAEVRQYNKHAYTIGELTDVYPSLVEPAFRRIISSTSDIAEALNKEGLTAEQKTKLESKLISTRKALLEKEFSGYLNDDLIKKVVENKFADSSISLIAEHVEKLFILKTGFTTQTNYSYIFNILSQLFHGAPENGASSSVQMGELKKTLERYLGSGPADNIMFSHISPDNHDKPRVLHGLALDIDKFFQIAMSDKEVKNSKLFALINEGFKDAKWWTIDKSEGEKIKDLKNSILLHGDWIKTHGDLKLDALKMAEFEAEYEKVSKLLKADVSKNSAVTQALKSSLVSKEGVLTNEQKTVLEKAIDDYAAGRINKQNAAEISQVAIDHFSQRPYNFLLTDIVEHAFGDTLTDAAKNNIVADVHNNLMKPAFDKFINIAKTMLALPGNSTFFAGVEYGITGYETSSHNVTKHNRSALSTAKEWVKDERRGNFVDFYNQLKDLLKLRENPYLTSFVTGTPVKIDLSEVAANKANKKGYEGLTALYRYNKTNDTITVFNNFDADNLRNASQVTKQELDSIPLGLEHMNISDSYGSEEFVRILPNGKVAEGERYLINADGHLVSKSGKKITIDDGAVYFARKTSAVDSLVAKAEAAAKRTASKLAEEVEVKAATISESMRAKFLGTTKGKLVAGALTAAAAGLAYHHLTKDKKQPQAQH